MPDIAFSEHGTWDGAIVPAPTWFLAPGTVFADARLRQELSGDAVKVYLWMLWRNTVPSDGTAAAGAKEWGKELGLTGPATEKALEQLVTEKLLHRAWRHGCGKALFEWPEGDSCPGCGRTLEGLTTAYYRTAQNGGPTPKPVKTKPKAAPNGKKPKVEKEAGEKHDRVRITDAIKELALATGMGESLMTPKWWQSWGRVINAWYKELEIGGAKSVHSADDIVAALFTFYNRHWDFRSPHVWGTYIRQAVDGSLFTRKRVDSRELRLAPVRKDLVTNPEDVTADDLICGDNGEELPLEGRYF